MSYNATLSNWRNGNRKDAIRAFLALDRDDQRRFAFQILKEGTNGIVAAVLLANAIASQISREVKSS